MIGNFRARRLALGLTQNDVAGMIGVSQFPISKAERALQGFGPDVSAEIRQLIDDALSAVETARGVRPPRDHRLRQRREKLNISPEMMAWFAFGQPHMTLTLAHAENGCGSAEDIRRIRAALVWHESEYRRNRARLRREQLRIEHQRSVFASLADHPQFGAVVAAMINRCRDLMDQGAGEECDVIAEWLPAAEVEAMFNEWEADQEPKPSEERNEVPVDG